MTETHDIILKSDRRGRIRFTPEQMYGNAGRLRCQRLELAQVRPTPRRKTIRPSPAGSSAGREGTLRLRPARVYSLYWKPPRMPSPGPRVPALKSNCREAHAS